MIGYIAHKTNYHVTAILIGVILGPLFEQYLVRALRLSEGDLSILFSSTLGNVLWALLVLSLLLPAVARLAAKQADGGGAVRRRVKAAGNRAAEAAPRLAVTEIP